MSPRRNLGLALAVAAALASAIVPASPSAAERATWLYTPSGAPLGRYALDSTCDHPEIWWDDSKVGRVLVSGNPTFSYAYARRITADYWRLAEVPGSPHLGTVRRVGKRWVLRNPKGRVVIYIRGHAPVEAALAYLTFGSECSTA